MAARRDPNGERLGRRAPESMARVRPPLTEMIWGSCSKSVIAVPSIAVTRSPAWMPAAAAALPLTTSPMTGASTVWPAIEDQAGQKHDGENEIGQRARRGDQGALPERLEAAASRLRSAALIARRGRAIGREAALASPANFT